MSHSTASVFVLPRHCDLLKLSQIQINTPCIVLQVSFHTTITMAVPVLPYTVHYYNSLPELQAAKDQFESRQASDILFTKIGETIVKHGVEKMLGIVLLHNHFLLERHEMLVNFELVAVPVATGSGTKELGAVSACAWRCVENSIAPYEFTHAGEEIRLESEQMQSFLAEFGAILAEKNLSNILGICSLREKPFDRPTTTEFTSGRANITCQMHSGLNRLIDK